MRMSWSALSESARLFVARSASQFRSVCRVTDAPSNSTCSVGVRMPLLGQAKEGLNRGPRQAVTFSGVVDDGNGSHAANNIS